MKRLIIALKLWTPWLDILPTWIVPPREVIFVDFRTAWRVAGIIKSAQKPKD